MSKKESRGQEDSGVVQCRVDGCTYTTTSQRGANVHMGCTHDDEERREVYIDVVHDLVDQLDHTPTAKDVEEYGSCSINTLQKTFGSWNDALRAAGVDPNVHARISRQELLDELHRLADELGRRPGVKDMESVGKYTVNPYHREFGAWTAALEFAGFEPPKSIGIPEQDLIGELVRLSDELERPPTGEDMVEFGEYGRGPYNRVFGSWGNALETAGLEAYRHTNPTREDLIGEIQRLEDELGRRPIVADMNKYGRYGHQTYCRNFGTWNNALEAAGVGAWEAPTGQDHHNWNEGKAGYYGPNWHQQRREALKRDGECCVGCGRPRDSQYNMWGRDLSVHHKRPLKTFPFIDEEYNREWDSANALTNLMTCCTGCHDDFEEVSRAKYPPDKYPRHIQPDSD